MFARLCTLVAALSLLAGSSFAQEVFELTDPQIAHIAYTAGDIDLTAAKQAISKSNNKTVVALAENMLRDHEAVHEQARNLLRKLSIKPEDNDTSRALSEEAADTQAELAKLSGAAYDEAYVANEVAYHKSVSGALEKALIPSARSSELKQLLENGLNVFQGHQKHAEQVAGELR